MGDDLSYKDLWKKNNAEHSWILFLLIIIFIILHCNCIQLYIFPDIVILFDVRDSILHTFVLIIPGTEYLFNKYTFNE